MEVTECIKIQYLLFLREFHASVVNPKSLPTANMSANGHIAGTTLIIPRFFGNILPGFSSITETGALVYVCLRRSTEW